MTILKNVESSQKIYVADTNCSGIGDYDPANLLEVNSTTELFWNF